MTGPNRLTLHRSLSAGDFRRMAIQKAIDIINTLQIREESLAGTRPGAERFEARRAASLIHFRTIHELAATLNEELDKLSSLWISTEHSYKDFEGPFRPLTKLFFAEPENGLIMLDAYNEMLRVEETHCGISHQPGEELCRITADRTHIYFFIDQRELDRQSEWQEGVADTQFLVSVSTMLQGARKAKRSLTMAETAIVSAAYELLGRGRTVTAGYRGLGVPGFKRHQTLLFNTDPGEGHLRVTCADSRLMEGAAVHIEHIDRDEGADREKVEPYRLPAAVNAAKVRLHVGNEAPCTAYIGRPIFENWSKGASAFAMDKLKSVHMTASACTAMFMNGIVDCKVAIERMTASEAVLFMKAVVGNVFRDRCRQYLSAAFNIHTAIVDDRKAKRDPAHEKPVTVSDPMALCRLGIELVAEGGFDKVTWDGSTNVSPSVPILEQLSHAQVVELVHLAHERGLTTYVSAGLLAHHMTAAVETGLDGVGIGISLHYFDKETRRTGELKSGAILEILENARKAEETPLGKAASLLARLDRLHYEEVLDPAYEPKRKALFVALRDRVEDRVEAIRAELADVEQMPCDDQLEHTCVGRARRLLYALRKDPQRLRQLEGEHAGIRCRLERVAAGETGHDPADFVLYHRDFPEFIGLTNPSDANG